MIGQNAILEPLSYKVVITPVARLSIAVSKRCNLLEVGSVVTGFEYKGGETTLI